MNQATTRLRLTDTGGSAPTAATKPLPGLPRRQLTPQEQLEALGRVQAQAEQRLRLGAQLFKAAQSQAAQHRQFLEEIKTEQDRLCDEIRTDMTRTLNTYDQWIGSIEQDMGAKLETLEKKLSKLHEDWTGMENRLTATLRRTETMLDQSRYLLEASLAKPRAACLTQPAPILVAATPAAPAQTVSAPEPENSGEQTTPHAPAAELPTEDTSVLSTLYTEIVEKLHNPST